MKRILFTITSDIITNANLNSISGKSIIIQSSGTSKTFYGNNSYSGFNISNSSIALSGLSFSSFTRNEYGGALYISNSSMTVAGDNISFNDNSLNTVTNQRGG